MAIVIFSGVVAVVLVVGMRRTGRRPDVLVHGGPGFNRGLLAVVVQGIYGIAAFLVGVFYRLLRWVVEGLWGCIRR